jgi:hypothetical protein
MLNAYAYEQRKSKLYNNPISLESIKLANSMSLANKRFQNQMATKGLVSNGQGGFQKAPWYDLVQSQGQKSKYKPADAPKIFRDTDVNESIMNQLKQGTLAKDTYTGNEFEENFNDNFINRILSTAASKNWTKIDDNVPVNNIETFKIIKNPNNTVSYRIKFEGVDQVKTIDDASLSKAYGDYFTGQNIYDYDSAVSTIDQSQNDNLMDAQDYLQSTGYMDQDFQQLLQEDMPVGYMLTPPTE